MKQMKILGSGGVGAVLADFHPHVSGHCLKIVKRSRDERENAFFWSALQKIQSWNSRIRFRRGFSKVPLAMQFWIRREGGTDAPPLSDLIQNCTGRLGDHGSLPEELAEVVPEEYILCSEDVLHRIYQEDRLGNRADKDLLVTYFLQQGKDNVENCWKNHTFTTQELLDCLYQILDCISYLHNINCAHRDIKPANILVNQGLDRLRFCLTDYDAFHTPESPSTAGTELFLPPKEILDILRKERKAEEIPVLLDCFALARTIGCMYKSSYSFYSTDLAALPPQVRELYRIKSFSLSRIREILTELEKEYNCWSESRNNILNIHSTVPFEEHRTCSLGSLGTFHEQIHFEKQFDPLLKTNRIKDTSFYEKFPDMMLFPLGRDDNFTYFHAPDDLLTRKRPRNFRNYFPDTWANRPLTQEEEKTLLEYGRRLDDFFSSGGSGFFLPLKEHILRVDGELRIFRGEGQEFSTRISYENYFRYLITGEGNFSPDEWLKLLPFLPELKEKAPALPCRWAWECFLKATGPEQGKLLQLPAMAQVLYSTPPEDLDEKSYFNAFLKLRKWDKENFLRWFPEESRSSFTEKQWEKLLACDPELFTFLPQELLPRLSRQVKVRLIGRFPHLMEQFAEEKFSSSQWVSILLQQPGLKKYCPADTAFTDKEQKRLDSSGL